MRYKQSTIEKVDAQINKLKSLQRGIITQSVTIAYVDDQLNQIIRDLGFVSERLSLEPNE